MMRNKKLRERASLLLTLLLVLNLITINAPLAAAGAVNPEEELPGFTITELTDSEPADDDTSGAAATALPASGAGEEIGAMNALDALGIDTSIIPEGYDEHSTDNPYGRNIVTMAPVHELFVTGKVKGDTVTEAVYGDPLDTVTEAVYEEPMFTVMEAGGGEDPWENTLYGHNKPLSRVDEHGHEHNEMGFFYNEGQSINVTMLQPIVAAATASGNFIGEGADGSAAGKTGQVVAVGAGNLDKNGGLYLYFIDPVTGAMSSQMKTLLNNDRIIGNTGNQMDEDFEECPYLMQNYLQLTTGDFDNNGIDEIATYVAEQGNSRVEIYKLHTTAAYDDDFYLDPGNWKKEWTYYFNEEPYVSNMVSLTSGDFNQDGIDDLALTWGYYYGPEENSGCQAVVMYGDKTKMLQEKKEIDLFFDTARIVRASFASGDITGDGVPELILGGQLDNDIKDGNLNTRFLAIYTYDGGDDCFVQTTAKNFDLFEKDENNSYTYPAMAEQGDKYHSVPGSPANIAVVKIEGVGELSYIYLDSILYEFEDQHLDIVVALDNHQDFNKYKDTLRAYYVEYDVVAADFTGDGRETLQLMQYYVPVEEIETVQEIGFQWWFITIYREVEITVPHPGELNMLGIYESDASFTVRRTEEIDFTTSFCKLDTDKDTVLLRYTGEKYIEYTDPEVLAVLASPPYFADLSNDALSGSYMSSETSYQESSGTGGGSFISHTISLGAYVSFEQEVSFWGIKAAKFEFETVFKGGFTYETQKKSMLEQSVSYSTPAGSDSVAFFSIPMEKYIYESETPIIDEDTGEILGTEKQLMTVNIPHTAAVQVLPLDTYERVSADYPELPQISGAILTHTAGDPTTYPSNTFGFKKPLVYSGDWSMVNYGGGSVTQEITMSDEAEQSYKGTAAVEFKIGAGAGGVVVGVVGGYEFGGGLVTISTSGSSFAGQIYNMPVEAQPYNYSYKWKLFSYEYTSGGNTFPVVNYLLTEVIAPPKLPTDFRQEMEGTTDEMIKLTWSYPTDVPVAGFQLYRYYEFPDGSGSYELAFVPASEYVRADEGTRYYEYVDTGLYPYTDYAYRVQTIGVLQPTDSIFSQVYTFRTKTGAGYPDISLQGPVDGKLLVYPDTERTVSVIINNMEDYTQTPRYQWQKLTEEGWVIIAGATGTSYTFRSAGLADEGKYRCRVNAIYENYLISDYSEIFTLEYRKRTPRVVDGSFIVRDIDHGDIEGGPKLQISLKSAHADHYYPPSGNVVFEVTGSDYKRSFTVELEESGLAGEAVAAVTLDSQLRDGAYLITAYYSGSRVYQSLTCEEAIPYLSGSESGYVLTFDSSYTYGDEIELSLNELEKDSGVTTAVPITGDVVCEVVRYSWEPAEDGRLERSSELIDEFITSEGNVTAAKAGKFTLVAYLNGAEVASREFTVAQRKITIGIEDQEAVAFAPYLTHPESSILKVHPATPLAYEDTLEDLGLAVRAANTAGTEVTIGSDTDPGIYTITGRAAEMTGVKYDNYHISYISGTYTLTGPKYNVAGIAELLNNKKVGTMELVAPAGHENWPEVNSLISHGTGLVFLAKPYSGYDIKRWSITNADTGDEIASSGSNLRLNYQMTAENIRVTVEFQVAQNRLYYMTSGGAGELVCTSDTVIQSGAVAMSGAEFTFKATPAEGYHFAAWQLHEIGKSPAMPAGTLYPDGSSTCEVTMGSGNTWLYAIFARDGYELTLQGDLQATYLVDPDIIGEEPEVVTVLSGARIKGDTEVTVGPRPGFSVKRDAVWRKDGFPVSADQGSDNQNYTFTMLADTEISVQTENEYYDVTLEVEGPGDSENAVSVTINGDVADAGNLSHIAGGSSLVFTPLPAYGYVFQEWIVNGEPISGGTLHVAALGGELTVKAVFTGNTAYTISLLHGLRGLVSYTLNGGEPSTVTSGGKIPVFKGDEVVLTATPEVNFMVEYWKIGGVVKQTTARTQTFKDISADIDVAVVFGAQTYATVTYAAGEGGAIISAKSDGISFASGSNSTGNGTTLEFTAAPDNGMMVKNWKLNGVEVKNDLGGTLVDTAYIISALSGDAHIEVSFKELLTHDVEVQNTNTGTDVQYYPDFGIEDEALDGATAVFTITPESGYQITSAGVTGNAGKEGLSGFDSITKKADGTWICVVGAVTADLTVTAVASKLYSITTPTVPVGGSITVSTDQAIEGEEITLTATPASASYIFDGWTVEPEEAGVKIEVDDSGAANTHFTMPASNVSVTAAFKYVPSPSPKPTPGGGGAPIRLVSEEGLLPLRLGSVTMQLPCIINNAVVSFFLDDSAMEEILALSSANELIIDLSGLEGFNSIECELDGKWLAGDRHISALTLTGLGEVTISSEMLKSFGVNQDSKVKIRIELGSITVSVELNGRAIEGRNSFHPIRVVYPCNSFRSDITIICDTKTGSIIPFSLFDGKGNIIFFTPYFGTFEARNNDKVFHDIAGHWAAGNIAFTAAREMFAGTSATEFSPDVPMTRAMFVTVLGRLLNIDEASYTGTSYPDVTAGQWYSPYVQWAAENDIVKGYGSGLFGPGDNITREQMAVIILRFAAYANLELTAESSEVIFKDKAEISSWAIEHVLNAQRFSLIGGKGNGFFDPRGTATRAEVATVLKRFIENVVRPREKETL